VGPTQHTVISSCCGLDDTRVCDDDDADAEMRMMMMMIFVWHRNVITSKALTVVGQ